MNKLFWSGSNGAGGKSGSEGENPEAKVGKYRFTPKSLYSRHCYKETWLDLLMELTQYQTLSQILGVANNT